MSDSIEPIEAFLDENARCWRERDAAALRAMIAPGEGTVLIGTDGGEVLRGGQAVGEAVAAQVSAAEAVSLEYVERHCHRRGDVAWLEAIVDLLVTVNGRTMEVPGVRQTAVLERQDGRWLLVQGHNSIGVRIPEG